MWAIQFWQRSFRRGFAIFTEFDAYDLSTTLKQFVLMQDDNAPSHKTNVHQFLVWKRNGTRDHLTSWYDMAPSNYVLFFKLKFTMEGTRYKDFPKIKTDMTAVQKKSCEMFHTSYNCCITVKETYREWINVFIFLTVFSSKCKGSLSFYTTCVLLCWTQDTC